MGRKIFSCFRHMELRGLWDIQTGAVQEEVGLMSGTQDKTCAKDTKQEGRKSLAWRRFLGRVGEGRTSPRTKSLRISTLKGYAETKLPNEWGPLLAEVFFYCFRSI